MFDEEAVAKALVGSLYERKGLSSDAIKAFDMEAYKERQYDILADAVRKHMDMEAVYRIIEEGI